MPAILLGVVLSALVATASPQTLAPSYPDHPIKLIVALAPGGPNDAIARLCAQPLGDILGQPVVIAYHGGAGGTIGADVAAKAPADGYTLLLGGSNNLAVAVALRPDLPYEPTRDFTTVGAVARVAYGLAVNPKLPIATVAELVAYARRNPGRLNYGSSGTASMSNLGAEMLKSTAGLDIVHIPYGGAAPAVAALVAGQIDLLFADLSQLLPHAAAGTLRLVAAAGERRATAAPELKTMAEQGLRGFDVEAWYGIVAPAGTPADIVARLRNALAATLRSPEFRQRLAQQGYDPIDAGAAGLDTMMRSDIDRYSALVRRANIKAAP